MLSALRRTGGPWPLRRAICNALCDCHKNTHNHPLQAYTALYAELETFVRSGASAVARSIYDAVESGDMERAEDLAALALHNLPQPGPKSSVLFDAGSPTEKVNHIKTPLTSRIFIVLVLLLIMASANSESKTKYRDDTVPRHPPKNLNPNPGVCVPRTHAVSVPAQLYEDLRNEFTEDAVSVRRGGDYEVFVGDGIKKNSPVVQHIERWIDFVKGSVDPAFAPTPAWENRLKIVLASDPPMEETIRVGAETAGYLTPEAELVFIRGGPYSPLSKQQVVRTVVHELSHYVHLRPRTFYGKLIEEYAEEKGMCARKNDRRIEDEAQAILYFGHVSTWMTMENALSVVNDMLDDRIKTLYESAKNNRLYWTHPRSDSHGYAFTNHQEFFAEASESYLVGHDTDKFPSRAWIRDHDPALYRLLGDVWSRAPPPRLDKL